MTSAAEVLQDYCTCDHDDQCGTRGTAAVCTHEMNARNVSVKSSDSRRRTSTESQECENLTSVLLGCLFEQ